ncbi:hypothetical protein CTAYLR_006580 [Chrysophaeum taylorii]|uniref:Galectin domain-containing protein n=1 Tax=Chrysophaeum taylorii TaxID=2483200 RepID=A0AAD7UNR3_9STRA|nr:hypothetical protein CTAYLR_006580 [Chrysophaeum taylorii]
MIENLVRGWAACQAAALEQEKENEEGEGRTAAEAELLECYEEEAKKASVVPAAEKASGTHHKLDLAPTNNTKSQQPRATKPLANLGGVAIRDDTTITERKVVSEDRPSDRPSAPSVSVPKRAKKTTGGGAPEPVDARAVAAPGGPLPEEGLVSRLRHDDSEPPWPSWTSNVEVVLPNYTPVTGNQTALLTVSVEADAERWAINVLPSDHDDAATVYFHFNPRKERRGILIVNDRFGDDWGKFQRFHLDTLPPLFGLDNAELAIQFDAPRDSSETTIFVSVNRKPVTSWTLRCPSPPPSTDLALSAQAHDDFGNDERITIHSIWWGWLPPI